MKLANIRCDKRSYALPVGKHKADNLRAFFAVPDNKDLWWDSSDDAVLVCGETELTIADGDRFSTAFKEINGA